MCVNPICINPQHLQAVTHKQNQKLKRKRPVVTSITSGQGIVLLRPPVKCSDVTVPSLFGNENDDSDGSA